MSEPEIKLVTTRPDAEVAADLLQRFRDAMGPVCAIMDEAARAGMALQYDAVGMGPGMRHQVVNPRVVKVLAP